MKTRTCAAATLTLVILAALAAPAAAQSRGERCRNPIPNDDATPGPQHLHIYSFNPVQDQQVDFDLYFNNDSARFLLLVVAQNRDTGETFNWIASASGPGRAARFVHASARMDPDTEYVIGVACVYAAADYRLAVRAGTEIRIGPRVSLLSHQGLSPAESARRFGWEEVLLNGLRMVLP